MLADLVRFFARGVLKTVYGLKAEGLEKTPKTGALIIACNHFSNADPPALDACFSGVREITFLAKKELFETPVVGTLLRQIKAISVDRYREGGDLGALKSALRTLEKGGCLVMFPEGTRSKDGTPLKPKAGIGFLAHKSGAPVLAARISGTKGFPFTRGINMKLGNTLSFAEFARGRDAKSAYAEFAEQVMLEIQSITEGTRPRP